MKNNQNPAKLKITNPQICKFLDYNSLNLLSQKSKLDDCISVVDINLKCESKHTWGFSIKSQIGNPSPLVNASKLTNFVFKIDDAIGVNEVKEINAISGSGKIQKRYAAIKNKSKLSFIGVNGDIYKQNLRLVDSELEYILAESLNIYYSGKERVIEKVVEVLNETNPCNYEDVTTHPYYSYKLKKFLIEHALGMIPMEAWNGVYHATGGFIVVRKDGELRSYHLMHKNSLEDYLYKNVKFDTGSSNSKKNDFGYIFDHPEHGQSFALNLMIKFIL